MRTVSAEYEKVASASEAEEELSGLDRTLLSLGKTPRQYFCLGMHRADAPSLHIPSTKFAENILRGDRCERPSFVKYCSFTYLWVATAGFRDRGASTVNRTQWQRQSL